MPKESNIPHGDQRRRQNARFPFVASLEARCSSWKSFHQLFSHNVSTTGLFVPSEEDAKVGETVEVMLHTPNKTVIRLEGKVAHLRPGEGGRPGGLGIHIMGVAEEDQVRYLDLVSKAAEECEVHPVAPPKAQSRQIVRPVAPPMAPQKATAPRKATAMARRAPKSNETSDNLAGVTSEILETTLDSISMGEESDGAAFLAPLNADALTTSERMGLDESAFATNKQDAGQSDDFAPPGQSDDFAPGEFFDGSVEEDPATVEERRTGRSSDRVISDSLLFNNDFDGSTRVPTNPGVAPQAEDREPQDKRATTTTLDSLSPITNKEIEAAAAQTSPGRADKDILHEDDIDLPPMEVAKPERKHHPTSTSLHAVRPEKGSQGAPQAPPTPPPPPAEAHAAPPPPPAQAHAAPPPPPAQAHAAPPPPPVARAKAPPAAPPPAVTPEMPQASGEGVHKPAPVTSRKRMPIVAMDFGTSCSSVAVVQTRQINVLRLPNGAWDIPSVVGFLPNGSVVLGDEARAMLATDPKNAINSPKRLLGRFHRARGLEPYLANLAMNHSEAPDRGIRLHAYNRNYSIEQVCAPIIYQLRLTAERALGGRIERAVFTTPVSFDDRRYAALERAADLAGVKVLEFVDEPTAAALCHRFEPSFKGLVAVYDFGGGTFDFSVVEASAADVQVVATAGDVWLGGDDFDEVLANAAANAFWREHKLELQHQVVQWQRLLVAAEHTKRELSYKESAIVHVKEVALTASGPLDLHFPVTRAQFSKLAEPIIQRSLDTCHEALELSDIKAQELSAIYLSGGTSYIPAVREGIARHFGLAPTSAIPPERAVVTGAAVYAALLRAGSITTD
ncbi:MAG: Hsp70 family protein [Deltaproteobacteria bacterium]|nr:Hsp70 family protein [Deltaproteobacteria bacterium]